MSNKPDKETMIAIELRKFADTFKNLTSADLQTYILGLIAGYEAMESFSASQNSELVERVKKLQSTCLAAAEEIQDKWEAHCDSDGYGPANLIRRLENGVGDYYSGYNAGQFTKLENQNSELKKENELWKIKADKMEKQRHKLVKEQGGLFATIEEKEKEIEELKQKVSDLTFDNMTYEYNETEGNEVWPQIEEQIREDERQKLQEEKDNEIERLKGLIEDAHEAGYNDGTFNNDMTISESWEQFKEANPF